MSRFQVVQGDLLYTNSDTGVTIHKGVIQPQQLPVAIKAQLSMDLPAANYIIREAMSMSALQHTNICQIYDCYIDKTDWGQFKAVILVEGMETDLWMDIMRRKSSSSYYSDWDLISILHALVSALSFAEERGICHRDIKPQNVFRTGTTFKIGDFGSANKWLSLSQMSQSIRGSPFFLSPELKLNFILKGQGQDITPYDPVRSDVYSLGLTVLCMALLEPPELLSNYEGLEAATSMYLSRLTQFPQTQNVLLRMLQVDPQKRPTFRELDAEFNGAPSALQANPQFNQANPASNQANPASNQANPAFSQAMLGSFRPQAPALPRSQSAQIPHCCAVCRKTFMPSQQFPNSPFCSSGCYQQSKGTNVCSICSLPITDKTWMRSMPGSLRPYEAFSESVCSAKCLEQYKQYSEAGSGQIPDFVQPLFNHVKDEMRGVVQSNIPQAAPFFDKAAEFLGSYLTNK